MATEMQNAYKDADGALRLMQEIQIMDEDITNKGGMLKGRQYTKLILEHFKTDRSLDKAWHLEDLYILEYPGDAKLQQLRYLWHRIVLCLQGEVSVEQLRKLLRRRLGCSKVLKEDIAHYDRQEGVEGSKDTLMITCWTAWTGIFEGQGCSRTSRSMITFMSCR